MSDKTKSAVDDDARLLAAARDAADQAYAPYSRFRVGAALRTETGGIFTGCNVENASYGLTMCAERNTIAAAVLSEGAGMRIAAMALFVHGEKAFPPCGACRQVLAQFALPGVCVTYAGAGSGEQMRTTVGELLPQAFRLTP